MLTRVDLPGQSLRVSNQFDISTLGIKHVTTLKTCYLEYYQQIVAFWGTLEPINIQEDDSTVGNYGGQCQCPDGEILFAGQLKGSQCSSLECAGGTMLNCNKAPDPRWSKKKVICNYNNNTKNIKANIFNLDGTNLGLERAIATNKNNGQQPDEVICWPTDAGSAYPNGAIMFIWTSKALNTFRHIQAKITDYNLDTIRDEFTIILPQNWKAADASAALVYPTYNQNVVIIWNEGKDGPAYEYDNDGVWGCTYNASTHQIGTPVNINLVESGRQDNVKILQ